MDARSQKYTQVQGWDKGLEVDSWARSGFLGQNWMLCESKD